MKTTKKEGKKVKISIRSRQKNATKSWRSYTIAPGAIVTDQDLKHTQYRREIEINKHPSKFLKQVFEELEKSGRKNYSNRFASDIKKSQRLKLRKNLNRELNHEEKKLAQCYGYDDIVNALTTIDDFEFPRFENYMMIDDWLNCVENSIRKTGAEYVEINGVRIDIPGAIISPAPTFPRFR